MGKRSTIAHSCKCGQQDPNKFYGKTKRICRSCQNKEATKRFREYKRKVVEYKGGCCQRCGYNKSIAALQLHHRDPNEKDLNYNAMKNWSAERRLLEADKCDLLCANCHAEIHNARLL